MLRSTLFDIAFLGFGGALLISWIDVQSGLVSFAVGALAAHIHSAITNAPRARRSQSGMSVARVHVGAAG
jgi:hypothetical protein